MNTINYLIVEPTPVEISRLMNKISVDIETGCWNWIGAKDLGGYGHVVYNHKLESAHRVFYAWKIEKLPRGKGKNIPQLDHICRNRACCNPNHMQLVTFIENILRGNSPSANHARQKYCKNGHLLPEKFNYYKPDGQGVRICLICTTEHEHSKERKESQRQARLRRFNGPRREELLKKHREYEAARRARRKHLLESP